MSQPEVSGSAAPSLLHEVAEFRRDYVHKAVTARLNACEGDADIEQISEWENEAHRRWREQFPAMTKVLIPNG